MAQKEHGIKTICGRIDNEPYLSYSSNGNPMWKCKLWATDNMVYNIMAIKDNALAYDGKFKQDDFIRVKGRHQTSTWNEDEVEEIVFVEVVRWEPSWGTKAEIINALQNYCSKLLDYDIGLNRDDFAIAAEYDHKHALLGYETDCILKCLSILQRNEDFIHDKDEIPDELPFE